jgi:hypothetical protein
VYRYVVDVETATHDDLMGDEEAGIPRRTCTRTSRVVVLAETDTEAVLVAMQMAACTSRGMPTAVLLRDFPTGG